MAATKLFSSLTRIDFAVAVSGRAVRISSRAVRVFPALSLRRVRPSYGTFSLMVFQGNCPRGRTLSSAEVQALVITIRRRKVEWVNEAENLCQMYVDFSYIRAVF